MPVIRALRWIKCTAHVQNNRSNSFRKRGISLSIGMIALIGVSLLILFGVLTRVLDRMALTDRQALVLAAAIFLGGWLPDIPFGRVSVNIGGALIPFIVCVYLLLSAGTAKERFRAIGASVIAGAAIFAIGVYFPADPVSMPFDPMLLYGAAAGLIAWLLGRSRRSAFIAGILGIIISDAAAAISVWMRGVNQPLHLGSAGALDASVLAGVTAVALCELTGEIAERMQTGKAASPHEDGAIEGGARA